MIRAITIHGDTYSFEAENLKQICKHVNICRGSTMMWHGGDRDGSTISVLNNVIIRGKAQPVIEPPLIR